MPLQVLDCALICSVASCTLTSMPAILTGNREKTKPARSSQVASPRDLSPSNTQFSSVFANRVCSSFSSRCRHPALHAHVDQEPRARPLSRTRGPSRGCLCHTKRTRGPASGARAKPPSARTSAADLVVRSYPRHVGCRLCRGAVHITRRSISP